MLTACCVLLQKKRVSMIPAALLLRSANLLSSVGGRRSSPQILLASVGATGHSQALRQFWGFSRRDADDDEEREKEKEKEKKDREDRTDKDNAKEFESIYHNKGEEESSSSSSKGNNKSSSSRGIISPNGEFSPTLSPLLILPANKKPIFPGYMSAITLKNEDTIKALTDGTLAHPNYVGVFMRKGEDSRSNSDEFGDIISNAAEMCSVGTFAQVQNIVRSESGAQLIVMGHRRISLGKFHNFGPPAIADVIHWKRQVVPDSKATLVKAHANEMLNVARELIKLSPLLQEQLQVNNWVSRIDLNDPFKLADFATALTTAEGNELQRILEAENIEERLMLVLELLAKEKELLKLQMEISKQVEEKVSKQQREYFLREQLKSIKKELGMEKDDKEDMLAKYREKLAAISSRPVKSDTLTLIGEEVQKLEALEKNSPEFNLTRSYLDWLFAIPWGKFSEDILSIHKARTILDEDHYGLDEVKKRILEFIAVGKLRGTVSGKIICFIGPPGVGKTSIATSIARALDKKFYRFSVGGLTDTAEIKGHRRTYIGAMPGKPVQALKSSGCLNPLILIDEIDKLGKSHNGDPASALLELLDPSQNKSFVDHYIDTPIDFSNVLFVCTANDESTIPGPLHDRMEIIRLSGYDIREKVAIAARYLLPKALKESGLIGDLHDNHDQYQIPKDTLEALIKGYCRESGVRSLEKKIEQVTRKIAFQKVGCIESDTMDQMPSTIVVTSGDLEKYLGKAIFAEETIYESKDNVPLPPGIVMGLAWNPLGGSPIFIETVSTPTTYSERDLGIHMVTGQLGSVMKESASIAYTFAKKFIADVAPDSKFFHSHQLHLHVPEGAISKDGPSAGVAMTTSFISVAMNKPLNPKVAMTGELSLTGKVLPVGGIKEKTLAAKRAGAKVIILPAANKRDFDELPDYVKEDVTVHFVKEYSDVYKVVFPVD